MLQESGTCAVLCRCGGCSLLERTFAAEFGAGGWWHYGDCRAPEAESGGVCWCTAPGCCGTQGKWMAHYGDCRAPEADWGMRGQPSACAVAAQPGGFVAWPRLCTLARSGGLAPPLRVWPADAALRRELRSQGSGCSLLRIWSCCLFSVHKRLTFPCLACCSTVWARRARLAAGSFFGMRTKPLQHLR